MQVAGLSGWFASMFEGVCSTQSDAGYVVADSLFARHRLRRSVRFNVLKLAC